MINRIKNINVASFFFFLLILQQILIKYNYLTLKYFTAINIV